MRRNCVQEPERVTWSPPRVYCFCMDLSRCAIALRFGFKINPHRLGPVRIPHESAHSTERDILLYVNLLHQIILHESQPLKRHVDVCYIQPLLDRVCMPQYPDTLPKPFQHALMVA